MTASWLSGFLAASLSPSALQHTVQKAWRREDGAGGRQGEERRGEVGGGSVFESEAFAVKLCTTPCGAGCVEREIIFPAEKHSPMWTWHPHLLLCTFRPSFAHLDLSLLSFTSLSFSFILFLFCNVGTPPLNCQRQAQENWTLLCLLSLQLSLLAITPYAGGYVVLWGGFACGMSNKQTSLAIFMRTALLNDPRKAWMWGIPSEVKRISFSSPLLFLYLKGLSPINGVLYGAHPIPFLPYALLQSSHNPPGETWALHFARPVTGENYPTASIFVTV